MQENYARESIGCNSILEGFENDITMNRLLGLKYFIIRRNIRQNFQITIFYL